MFVVADHTEAPVTPLTEAMETVPRKYSHDGAALPPDKNTDRTMKEDNINHRIKHVRDSEDMEATRNAKRQKRRNHVCSYCQGPLQSNPDNPDTLPYDTACGIEIHRICILLHQFYCKICQQHKSTIQDANSSTLESRNDATKL